MDTALFDEAIDAIAHGPMGPPVLRLLEAAAHAADAPGVMLTRRNGGEDYILLSRGLPYGRDRILPALPGTDRLFKDGPIVIPNVGSDPLLRDHPLRQQPPGWEWAVVVPVHLPGFPDRIAMTVGDSRRNVRRSVDMTERLRRIAEVLADEIGLIAQIVTNEAHLQSSFVREDVADPPRLLGSRNNDVVSEFLLATLVPQRRLLRRGGTNYHVVRRWRAALKPWQLAGMKAIKRDVPPQLVRDIAKEIAETAGAIYGTKTCQAVANVPCGNSGPNCLAHLLGAQVAVELDVPFIQAFAPLPVCGSSHPRKNPRRPPMRFDEPVDMPVLLVDDIATTGAHIDEAATRLRKVAPAVFPIVWIAD